MGGLPPEGRPLQCVAWGVAAFPLKGPGSGHTPMTVPASRAGATPESAINRPIPGKSHLLPLRPIFSAELSTAER